MKKLILITLGVFAYTQWRKHGQVAATPQPEAEATVALLRPLPSGAQLTGKVQNETNPHSIRRWAEIVFQNGQRDWVEVRIEK